MSEHFGDAGELAQLMREDSAVLESERREWLDSLFSQSKELHKKELLSKRIAMVLMIIGVAYLADDNLKIGLICGLVGICFYISSCRDQVIIALMSVRIDQTMRLESRGNQHTYWLSRIFHK